MNIWKALAISSAMVLGTIASGVMIAKIAYILGATSPGPAFLGIFLPIAIWILALKISE